MDNSEYLDMVLKFNGDSWSNLKDQTLGYARENVWCHYHDPDQYIYCIAGDPVISDSSYQFIDVFDTMTDTFVDINVTANITNVSNPRVAYDDIDIYIYI